MAKIKIAVGTTSEQKIKNIINLWNKQLELLY